MAEHEHDWWRTPKGSLRCACGAERWPTKKNEEGDDD